MNFVNKFLFVFLTFCLFFWSNIFLVQGELIDNTGAVVVTPTIIDQKAKARDLLEYSLILKNSSPAVVFLYPIVNDISIQDGKQEFLDPTLLSKANSLARWIDISRGVIILKPGEERTIPLAVKINLEAQVGRYYVAITFSDGPNRPEAEKNALKFNQPQVILSVEVEENVIEKAQIRNFQSKGKLFIKSPVTFTLEIENIGNRGIKTVGYINIYNRRGQEVGRIDLNQNGEDIQPQSKQLADYLWQAQGGLGQYKAKLTIEYGQLAARDLQDTIYFWFVPWPILIVLGVALMILFLLCILSVKKIRKSPLLSDHPPSRVIDLRKS